MRPHDQQQKRKSAKARRSISTPPSPRRLRRQRFLAKWRAWDWTKQNVELAAETGLSTERIRQIRRILGAPPSPYHLQRPAVRRLLAWAKDNLDKLRGMTWREIQQMHGLDVARGGRLYDFLRQHKVCRFGNLRHPWDQMNFELPSSVLQRVWKLPRNMVASYRLRKGLAPARWPLKGRLAYLRKRGPLRGFLRAVKAEEKKAQRYRPRA